MSSGVFLESVPLVIFFCLCPRLFRLTTGLKPAFSVFTVLHFSPHPPFPLSQSSTHFILLAMQTCMGSSKSSEVCGCTQFTPRQPPKEGKCAACGHRKAAHTNSVTSHKNTKYVERLLGSLTSAATAAAHETARQETVKGYRPVNLVRILFPLPSAHILNVPPSAPL